MSNLVSTPDWIGELNGCSPHGRIDTALRLLRALGYVKMVGRVGEDLSLQTTDPGADWLAASAKNRLMTILDQLNPNKSKTLNKRRSPTADRFNDLVPEFIDDNPYDAPRPFELMPSPCKSRAVLIGTSWRH